MNYQLCSSGNVTVATIIGLMAVQADLSQHISVNVRDRMFPDSGIESIMKDYQHEHLALATP